MNAKCFADELKVKPELFSRGDLSISEICSYGGKVVVMFDDFTPLEIEDAIEILESHGSAEVEFEEYVNTNSFYNPMTALAFIPGILLLIFIIGGR